MNDPNLPMDPRGRLRPSRPASPPAAPPTFGETSFVGDVASIEEKLETRPSLVGRLSLVVAALAVAGSGVVAVSRALSEPAGPQSPEDAVDQLFEAVENDDLVGLFELLLPSERASLVDPMVDLFAELERLDIVDGNVDLQSSDGTDVGLDFSVDGLEFVTSTVGQGVVNVELTGGVVTVDGRVDDLPFGSRVGDELSAEDRQEVIAEEIVDFGAEDDVTFTVVQEDGSWYVSLWYSVAEELREEAGVAAPAFGAGVKPAAASTPEDAVRAMVNRAVDLDLEGVIATLDPQEFRALYDYAPLFLDEAEQGVAEIRSAAADESVTWSLDRLDLRRDDGRGRILVEIEGFAFSAEADGEALSVDFDGNCITTIIDREIDEICLDEATDEFEELGLPDAYLDVVAGYRSGITVVEREGAWFVSGMPTILGTYTDLLAELEPEDIEDLTSFVSDTVEGAFEFADPFGSSFGTDDPYIIDVDPFVEDEPYDPFADDEGFDDDVAPTLDPASADTFLPGLDLTAGEPENAYFAFATGLEAAWYTYGFSPQTGATVEIVAFDVSSADLIAAMNGADAYTRLDVDGLPDGAVAYEWPDVDRVVVVGNHLVSAYYGFEADQDLLIEQVNYMGNR